MFKTFNAVFGVLFVICAALQWNDPDLYLWIPLYLLAALSCALAYAQVPALRLNLAVIAIYLIYAAYLFVAQDGVWSWMFEHQFDSLTQSMLAWRWSAPSTFGCNAKPPNWRRNSTSKWPTVKPTGFRLIGFGS
jgi:hypothetical protein